MRHYLCKKLYVVSFSFLKQYDSPSPKSRHCSQKIFITRLFFQKSDMIRLSDITNNYHLYFLHYLHYWWIITTNSTRIILIICRSCLRRHSPERWHSIFFVKSFLGFFLLKFEFVAAVSGKIKNSTSCCLRNMYPWKKCFRYKSQQLVVYKDTRRRSVLNCEKSHE